MNYQTPMMNDQAFPRRAGLSLITGFLLIPALALGQLATEPAAVPDSRAAVTLTPQAPNQKAEDATIELTPFEVRAEKDEGYLAQNTASGSRLSTSLKDTPAPISVFTTEFLQDIAATDIASLSEYTVNTERVPGFQGGAATGNNLGEFDTQFRVRGLSTSGNEGRSVNFFKYGIEVDVFNTERVEFARGPNSILFGLGSVAGNFNVSTKKADVRRPRYEVTFRTDSNESFRTAVDINQPIIDGKLGLRLNLLKEQTNTWRPHEFKDSERLALAARWQIARNTTLDVEYERDIIAQSNQRKWLGEDFITDWIAKGRTLDLVRGSPYTPLATPPAPGYNSYTTFSLTNVGNTATQNYLVFDSASGTIANWRGMSTSGVVNHLGTAQVPGPTDRALLRDFSLVPIDAVLGGPGVGADVGAYSYSAFLRHELFKNLFIEVATNRQKDDYNTRDILAPQYNIHVDTNVQLPDGTSNPNVGRPYLEGTFGYRLRDESVRDHRATIAYEFDLGPRFGRHQLAGLVERRDERTVRDASTERVLNAPLVPGTPEDAANQIVRRTYFNFGDPSGSIALADFRTQPINGVANVSTGTPLTTFFANGNPNNAAYDYEFKFTTFMLATQSRFWNDRLVATIGYREDTSDALLSSTVRATPVGGYTQGFFIAQPGASREKSKGSTRSQGAVFHVNKWASLFYNRSSNFALRNPQVVVFPGTSAPAPKGKSEDLGAKFSLLNGKLYATLTYYETTSINENDFVAPGGVGDINNIWTTLNQAGVLAANGLVLDQVTVRAGGNTFDSKSQGWEFELIANPLRNWRVSLNYSENKTVRTRISDEIIGYVAEKTPFFTEGTRGRLVLNGTPLGQLAPIAVDPTDNLTTIAERIATINQAIVNTVILPLGARAAGFPTQSANLTTRYSFTGGWLNGFSVGGGGRWRGKPVVGYTSTDPATRQILMGEETILVDANIKYERKLQWFGRKMNWSLQLNAKNLLDADQVVTTSVFADGFPKQYTLQAPREFILTSTFRF